MSEELKPCPYHGDSSAMEFASASNKYAACRKCDRNGETWYRPVEDWNSAYCWKELDAKDRQIQELTLLLATERDAFGKRETELMADKDRQIKELMDFVEHDKRCILSYSEAGEPTPDGGYRCKFKGKWYQARPIDELPKCDCGLDDILARHKSGNTEGM